MSTSELVSFAGMALIYAALITVAVRLGAWALGRAMGWAGTAATFPIAFFLSLTHHPFPDREALDCSDGGVEPRLVPFRFVGSVYKLWTREASAGRWIHDLTISSAVMNLFLCVAIGGALALCTLRTLHVLIFAMALTTFVEISQITGVFGIYPCPYRQFDVDDMILNVAGVMLGFAFVHALRCVLRRPAGAD